ncbi:hypothetical protein SAMN05421505_120126 [Sinosporangium album]|uniref:Uncharacterized protein n=1 Tax=Sinosporangium album TaxID=504805 RepID=A0A1G8EJT6_9ACTN|nr:hypothetical protein [Sinosporangium album]SDH69989.1 hypothetical protein SAMN05421505_120126 [Sinosporangium album]
MNAPHRDDVAAATGCGAALFTIARHLITAALTTAAILTSGPLSGVLWSLTALTITITAALAATLTYRRLRTPKTPKPTPKPAKPAT